MAKREQAEPSFVRETNRINIDYHPVSGRKMLNRYEIYGELGRGQHGKVKLGRDEQTGDFVAIKTVNRKDRPRLGRPSGFSAESKVRQEIAILKKCNHPNIVRLREVLDDQTSRKIYLVLEYLEQGEVKWQNTDQTPALSRERARQVAAQTLLGLEYLHKHGIIHRDIKPANLLLSGDNQVKISDFGVSYAYTSQDGDELEMAKTVGSPAFFAPEMCIFEDRKRPRISSKIDIWAYGVTLYCLLYGHLPFDGDNEYELFRIISDEKSLVLPPANGDKDLESANDLLTKLLEKDPEKRIDIPEIKNHPWLRPAYECLSQLERTEVSPEEVDHAVRGIAGRIRDSFSKLRKGLTRASMGSTGNTPNQSSASISNDKVTYPSNMFRADGVPIPKPPCTPPVTVLSPRSKALYDSKFPSEDTLNMPSKVYASDSESDSGSESDHQLTLVIGQKKR